MTDEGPRWGDDPNRDASAGSTSGDFGGAEDDAGNDPDTGTGDFGGAEDHAGNDPDTGTGDLGGAEGGPDGSGTGFVGDDPAQPEGGGLSWDAAEVADRYEEPSSADQPGEREGGGGTDDFGPVPSHDSPASTADATDGSPYGGSEPPALAGQRDEQDAGTEPLAGHGEGAVGAMESALHGEGGGDGAGTEPSDVPGDHEGGDATADVSTPNDARADEMPVAPSPRPLPRVLAVANQKGGVGKTTTAVNLGAALAEAGYRVLICDLDPQGNASTGLGLNPREMATSMYDVILNGLPLEDCIEPTSVRNLFVAPASLDLAGAEIELVPAFSREMRLKRAIEAVLDDYDFVLIDCPPSLGLLTVNGLAAAHEVLVPIQCEYYALEGLGQLLRNVNLVQRNLNPTLELSTIICVMYDARTKLSDQVVQEVRAHFGDKVCRNVVPRTVRLSEAPSFGQPITTFDPTSRGAIAYRELAKEVSGGAPQRTG